MQREQYCRQKFEHFGTALGRDRSEAALSVKFRNAFFCECDVCGWQPALAEFNAATEELQRRDLAVWVEPHETGIEIIAYGTAGTLLSAAIIRLAKLILVSWNRPRKTPEHRDIEIEVRSVRTDGRFAEERIAKVRYPARDHEIEKAFGTIVGFLSARGVEEEEEEDPGP